MAKGVDVTAPAPLTIAHQGLAACLAVVCVDVIRGPEVEDALTMTGDLLGQAHADGPMAEAIVQAARAVLYAWPDRLARDGGALRWNAVVSQAAQVVRAYYRQRAAACHDRIFPQPETQGAAHA